MLSVLFLTVEFIWKEFIWNLYDSCPWISKCSNNKRNGKTRGRKNALRKNSLYTLSISYPRIFYFTKKFILPRKFLLYLSFGLKRFTLECFKSQEAFNKKWCRKPWLRYLRLLYLRRFSKQISKDFLHSHKKHERSLLNMCSSRQLPTLKLMEEKNNPRISRKWAAFFTTLSKNLFEKYKIM